MGIVTIKLGLYPPESSCPLFSISLQYVRISNNSILRGQTPWGAPSYDCILELDLRKLHELVQPPATWELTAASSACEYYDSSALTQAHRYMLYSSVRWMLK